MTAQVLELMQDKLLELVVIQLRQQRWWNQDARRKEAKHAGPGDLIRRAKNGLAGAVQQGDQLRRERNWLCAAGDAMQMDGADGELRDASQRDQSP